MEWWAWLMLGVAVGIPVGGILTVVSMSEAIIDLITGGKK